MYSYLLIIIQCMMEGLGMSFQPQQTTNMSQNNELYAQVITLSFWNIECSNNRDSFRQTLLIYIIALYFCLFLCIFLMLYVFLSCFQVEIDGEVWGKGVGLTWDEAKMQVHICSLHSLIF